MVFTETTRRRKQYLTPPAWELTDHFSVIGASCPVKLDSNKVRIEDCQFRDPGFDGGSCLKGFSDIFVHCDPPKKTKAGEWSDWQKSDLPCDPFQDYFTQEFRNCENGVNGYCIGPWLKASLRNWFSRLFAYLRIFCCYFCEFS